MLPDLPTLLTNPSPAILKRLVHLVKNIECPSSCTTLRGNIVEECLHFSRNKIAKTKNKTGKNDQQHSKLEASLASIHEAPLSQEEKLLQQASTKKWDWKSIAKILGFEQKTRKGQWNYSQYLDFEIIRRMPGTLGYFVGIHILERSWEATRKAFETVHQSTYINDRVSSLLKKGPGAVSKLQYNFQRNMLIALLQDLDVPQTIEKIHLKAIKKFKDQTEDFQVDQWHSYLCSQLKNNKANERPTLRLNGRTFTVKWTKCKKISAAKKQAFEAKLAFIKKNVKDLRQAYLDDVNICLLQAVFSMKDWQAVQKEMTALLDHMNDYEIHHEPEPKSRVISQDSTNDDKRSNSRLALSIELTKDRRRPYNSFCQQENLNCSLLGIKKQAEAKLSTTNQLVQTQPQFFFCEQIILNSTQVQTLFYMKQIEKEFDEIVKAQMPNFSREQLNRYYQAHQVAIQDRFRATKELMQDSDAARQQIKNQNIKRLVYAHYDLTHSQINFCQAYLTFPSSEETQSKKTFARRLHPNKLNQNALEMYNKYRQYKEEIRFSVQQKQ